MRNGAPTLRRGAVTIFALVMALALAACTGLPGAPLGQTSAKVTTTKTPAPTLNWRKAALPAGIDARAAGIAVSPANGREAWLCAPASDPQGYQAWRTDDAGTTWVKVSYLKPTASQAFTTCALTANQSDASAVALNFTWGAANAPVNGQQGSQSYYSTDGGTSWSALPTNIWVSRVVTVGATTYAQLFDTSQRSIASLVTSGDHLASWHTISAPTKGQPPDFQFWAAATPGELLWANMNANGALYTDNNGSGGLWHAITPPPTGEGLQVTLAVWQPAQATGSHADGWLICGYVQKVGAQNSAMNVCTRDRGATWTTLPPLKNTWECAHCGQVGGASSGVNPCLASAITANGALYAVCGDDPQDSGVAPTPWTVSRIAPGSSTWATLGQAPCQQITTTRTGQAWCFDTVGHSAYVLDALP
ncbi:MAG TPA: hypothetical protein VE338_13155 [Ktedonobacterales bacterium]|nr:hypothetical protein [Ktedonobacterales bacterium]